MKFLLAMFFVSVACISTVFAQGSGTTGDNFTKAGSTGGLLLKMPVGARAIAMGGAFSGMADDISAIYWNPAGVALFQDNLAGFEYAQLFGGIGHGFVAASTPLSKQYNLAGSISFLSTGNIPVTTILAQDGNGASFQASDICLGLTLGGNLTEKFSFGITGKYIHSGLYDLSASGIAFDVGTLYRTDFYGMTFGLAISNLGTPENFTGASLGAHTSHVDPSTGQVIVDSVVGTMPSNSYSLPLLFRAGVAIDLLGQVAGIKGQKLMFSTDFVTLSDNPEKVMMGAEYWWEDIIALRGGFQFLSDQYDFSAGVGLKYETGTFHGTIDYAFSHTKDLGSINRIGIGMRFQ